MGIYNEVYFSCPNCGNSIINQTKSGSCQLESFSQNAVPPEEIAGLDDHVCCDECGKEFHVVTKIPIQTIPMGLVEI